MKNEIHSYLSIYVYYVFIHYVYSNRIGIGGDSNYFSIFLELSSLERKPVIPLKFNS